MDVVVTSSRSASEPQHVQYDNLHRNTEPTAQRRHIRYTSPDLSTPHSPRRLNETTATAAIRPASHGDETYPPMSRPSPVMSPFSVAQVLQGSEAASTSAVPETGGQNHDRMETDVESEGSVSDEEPHDTAEDVTVSSNEGTALGMDSELMDTTPDAPMILQAYRSSDVGQAMESSTVMLAPLPASQDNVESASPSGTINDAAHDDSGAAAAVAVDVPAHGNRTTPDPSPLPPISLNPEAGLMPPPPLHETGRSEADEVPPVDSSADHPPPPPPPDSAASGWGEVDPTDQWEGDPEEESPDEDSTDEEDNPFWTSLKEDTSGPDEEELKVIEGSLNETSALDHEYWEKFTYEALDDPEYSPSDVGRISWTVRGVNGTVEKPNKERVMKSPAVRIGNYYWNIKYYPRGNPNEGTEQLSVYIECSDARCEEGNSNRSPLTGASATASTDEQDLRVTANAESRTDTPPAEADSTVAPSQGAQPQVVSGDTLQPSPEWIIGKGPEDVVPWEVAAQISCVIYNPEEPRVNVAQKSSHRYCKENPDWGWTRFHGPWDEIHKRQRFKRQALLRNDTLAFTAYIRTVNDNTGSLWWHMPKDKLEWDSVARIGLKRLVDESSHSSALIAALSAWLHLVPVTDLVCNTPIPDPWSEPTARTRPLIEALQRLIQEASDLESASSSPNSTQISLGDIARMISWYGEDDLRTKSDVVATWETLRSIISYEASNAADMASTKDVFSDLWALKYSDANMEEKIFGREAVMQDHDERLPHSVQATLDLALKRMADVIALRQASSEAQQPSQHHPSIMQIELQRQRYSSEDRRWKKLTHHIHIDETISVDLPIAGAKVEYTLYGMIVHSGALESQDYYSVIRPAGPGTTWVKYAGGKDPKGVTRLTRKQACDNHEGSGQYAEGTAAVAYVVLYVRTDSMSDILDLEPETSTPTSRDEVSAAVSKDVPMTKEELPAKSVTVQIYQSDVFQAYAGRGILDSWTPQVSPNPAIPMFEFQLDENDSLAMLERYLMDQAGNAGKNERFMLWALNAMPQNSARNLPRFETSYAAELTLAEVVTACGACRLWLHVLPSDEYEEILRSTRPPEPQPTNVAELPPWANPNRPHQSTAEPVTDPAGEGSTEVRAVPGEPAEPSVESNEETPRNQEGALAPENVESMADSAANQVQETVSDEDTLMAGVHEVENLEGEIASQPSYPPLISWEPCDRSKIYIFVKIFDCKSQSLRGVGSFFVKKQEQIGDGIRRLLQWGLDEAIDVFHESALLLGEKDRLRLSSNFVGTTSAIFDDGSVFIVQQRSSEVEIAKLEADGKCTNLVDYFAWLRRREDPSYLQDHRCQLYFGGPYISTSQKHGRPHGSGVLISSTGDAYQGSFVAGRKSGHGTMTYANGDTYTGEWQHDEPNGQGKMVYAKTGNVYVGGFRKRKRHGKGTMQFEVADEDLQMCNICYEEEMDALFYDCGHVTACEECAKQVDVCPVCRKSVRAVVKIWRT